MSNNLGRFPWLEYPLEQIFFYSCFSLILAFSCPFYFAQNRNKRSLTTFKEWFHYGTVCGVQRETTTFNFSRQEKWSANDIWRFRKNVPVKILEILFNEKLQITHTFRCNPLWRPYARFMHLITEMKPQRQAIIKLMYAMSTIENHSFENESQINYIAKWFKAQNLLLIGKHILTCLFLPKAILPMKYDPLAHVVFVRQRRLKNLWK